MWHTLICFDSSFNVYLEQMWVVFCSCEAARAFTIEKIFLTFTFLFINYYPGLVARAISFSIAVWWSLSAGL